MKAHSYRTQCCTSAIVVIMSQYRYHLQQLRFVLTQNIGTVAIIATSGSGVLVADGPTAVFAQCQRQLRREVVTRGVCNGTEDTEISTCGCKGRELPSGKTQPSWFHVLNTIFLKPLFLLVVGLRTFFSYRY